MPPRGRLGTVTPMSIRQPRHLRVVPAPEHGAEPSLEPTAESPRRAVRLVDVTDGEAPAVAAVDTSEAADGDGSGFEDDFELPCAPAESLALWAQMDALFVGLSPEEHLEALLHVYFDAEGNPRLPPTLREVSADPPGQLPPA